MSIMTWNEFKTYVDAELERQGARDDVKIAMIRTTRPQNNEPYSPDVIFDAISNGIIIEGGLLP